MDRSNVFIGGSLLLVCSTFSLAFYAGYNKSRPHSTEHTIWKPAKHSIVDKHPEEKGYNLPIDAYQALLGEAEHSVVTDEVGAHYYASKNGKKFFASSYHQYPRNSFTDMSYGGMTPDKQKVVLNHNRSWVEIIFNSCFFALIVFVAELVIIMLVQMMIQRRKAAPATA